MYDLGHVEKLLNQSKSGSQSRSKRDWARQLDPDPEFDETKSQHHTDAPDPNSSCW